ncbi:MAG TPA: helix-turn-helix domain-containing protein [Longimicrobium sp.]
MADILLLSASPAAAGRVRRAVQSEHAGGVFHALRPMGGWAELTAAAASSAGAVAFVDPWHGGSFAAAEIRRLRERAPGVEVVALADFSVRPAADAFSLALLGVRGMVCDTRDDGPAALVRCLREHLNRGPLEEMMEALAGLVPATVHRWLALAFHSSLTALTVPALARSARCSPRTLRRTLQAAGLPSPEQILAWRRLLHAARLLDDGRSADSVARALEFSSGSALRKSLKQVTGLRPRELAAGGGLRLMAALFLARCGKDAAQRRPLARGRARLAMEETAMAA